MITDIILCMFIDLDQISSTATFLCDPDLDFFCSRLLNKGEGSASAIFGPIQDLIVLVIVCSNTSYNGKIGCFRLIFQVFSIFGLKVKKPTKNR